MCSLGWSAETTEPYVFRAAPNLAHKTMRPVQVSKGLYRLQTNPALYEGVRYGFVIIHPCVPNATVRCTTPEPLWHIRAIRLVSQTPPVNYVGSVVGDDELSRIFLSGSYCPKLNMLPTVLGTELMDRGDRSPLPNCTALSCTPGTLSPAMHTLQCWQS